MATMKVFLELKRLNPDLVIYNAPALDPTAPLPFLVRLLGIPQVAIMAVYFPNELKAMTRNELIAAVGSFLYNGMMRQISAVAAQLCAMFTRGAYVMNGRSESGSVTTMDAISGTIRQGLL